jgi:C4-dicarboxylate-specific signal transduction histidine kinase
VLEVSRQAEAITVRITDQGPGIAHDMLDCLFEPFATNRSQGTGLGLAIALNAIRAHRGDIQARNLSTGGAEFTITLPQDLNAADMP